MYIYIYLSFAAHTHMLRFNIKFIIVCTDTIMAKNAWYQCEIRIGMQRLFSIKSKRIAFVTPQHTHTHTDYDLEYKFKVFELIKFIGSEKVIVVYSIRKVVIRENPIIFPQDIRQGQWIEYIIKLALEW